jgi:methionyl-tRNA formyltransferase
MFLQENATRPILKEMIPLPALRSNAMCLRARRSNQVGFIEQIKSLEPDLILSIGYSKILRTAPLNVPSSLSVNFHASLLPPTVGKHPCVLVLRNGERWSGLTVHIMDPGSIPATCFTRCVSTLAGMTLFLLYKRIMIAARSWSTSCLSILITTH